MLFIISLNHQLFYNQIKMKRYLLFFLCIFSIGAFAQQKEFVIEGRVLGTDTSNSYMVFIMTDMILSRRKL